MAVDRIEELSQAFSRFPGIGPRQARRFVYYLLGATSFDRARLSELISHLADDIHQCQMCMRYAPVNRDGLCNYCSDISRDDSLLLLVEKDQDLLALERAGLYRGRYFVLGGVLTLSGKGHIRERELIDRVEARIPQGLKEIVFALSATSEGEHTTERLRDILTPLRTHLTFTELGRGLSTGSELEYADKETLSAALQNRKET